MSLFSSINTAVSGLTAVSADESAMAKLRRAFTAPGKRRQRAIDDYMNDFAREVQARGDQLITDLTNRIASAPI